MNEGLALGVVGLGAVAQLVYLPILARRPDLFRVAAVCDLSPTARDVLGGRYGVPPPRRHPRLTDLLEGGGVEAVALLHSGSHGDAARQVLEAGLPVLCEKPLAYTLAEADRLGSSGRLQLGYMKLFDPAVVEVRRLMAERGELRSLEVTVLHPSFEEQVRPLPPLLRSDDLDRVEREGLEEEVRALRRRALGPAARPFGELYTEVLLGSLVHDLALVRALAGGPPGIDHVETWPDGAFPPSVEVLGRLPGGARLSIRWHYLPRHPVYREELRLHTDDGTTTLVFPSPYLLHAPTSLTVTAAQGAGERQVRFTSPVEAFETQLVAFHELVTEETPPVAGIEEGRADIVTCQQMVRLLAQRRSLPVGGEAGTA